MIDVWDNIKQNCWNNNGKWITETGVEREMELEAGIFGKEKAF